MEPMRILTYAPISWSAKVAVRSLVIDINSRIGDGFAEMAKKHHKRRLLVIFVTIS